MMGKALTVGFYVTSWYGSRDAANTSALYYSLLLLQEVKVHEGVEMLVLQQY